METVKPLAESDAGNYSRGMARDQAKRDRDFAGMGQCEPHEALIADAIVLAVRF